MNKKTILIDLDGVLNTYNGMYDEQEIPPIKEGAIEFLKKLKQNYRLVLFSTREVKKVISWADKYRIKQFFADITNVKQPAFLTIDDRCIRFEGDYSKTLEAVEKFCVWWKNRSV